MVGYRAQFLDADTRGSTTGATYVDSGWVLDFGGAALLVLDRPQQLHAATTDTDCPKNTANVTKMGFANVPWSEGRQKRGTRK